MMASKFDLHLHSCFSDGTNNPEDLPGLAKEAGVEFFALTDHDSIAGCDRVVSALSDFSPLFIRGVEFSCEDEEGKYHILGYGYNNELPSIHKAVGIGHDNRVKKAENRVRFLKEKFGYTFSAEEQMELYSQINPGKPHFVNLMLRKGLVANREEGFARFQGFIEDEYRIAPEYAVQAILESDGIPVLAHGLLGDGTALLSEKELEKRVRRLKEAGLKGMECFYSGYTREQQDISIRIAENNHLLITAGSDYHGANKTVRIGETGLDNPIWMEAFFNAVKDRIIILPKEKK